MPCVEPRLLRSSVLHATVLVLLGAMGCNSSAQSEINPGKLTDLSVFGNVSEIGTLGQSQPGAIVNLRGKVVAQAPLLDRQAFELQDASGKIWVVGATVPPLGSDISISGTLRFQSWLIDGQTQGAVYLEQR